MARTREDDINDLIKSVLDISPEYAFGNSYDTTTCPFCSSSVDYEADRGMEEIKHDHDCAYLIAKDLMTGLTHPQKT